MGTRTRSTAVTTATIKVPLDDFIRCNNGMLRLLQALHKSKSSELPTIRLYNAAKMSNNYSRLALRKAERMGFIIRKRVPKDKGEKGNYKIVNSLTPKGRTLLDRLNNMK